TATDHKFLNYVSDNNSTCIENGTETAKCENCDETDTREKVNGKTPHVFENGKCKVCGTDEYTQELVFRLNDDEKSYSVSASYGDKFEKIIIPELYDGLPVTRIGMMAFANDNTLTEITIPDGVTFIGEDAFARCSSLNVIRYGGDVAGWCAIDGLEYLMKDTANAKKLFMGSAEVSDIVIPASVKSIGSYAFYGCAVTSITITEGVESIGNKAFGSCYFITEITIPESVTTIGKHPFDYCTSLTIYCKAEAKPDGWDNTWSSNGLSSSGFPVVWNCAQNDKDTSGYAYLTLNGVRFALKNGSAFVVEQPRNLVTAEIPESINYMGADYKLSYIDGGAFRGCDKLTSVKIAVGISNIYGYAFDGCSSLTDIYFEGTEEQWGQINKNPNWDKNTGNYTIHFAEANI
ncbi:MAG: leucine-rich repeat domain-containing protein, partial [Clostridia bacterium]|nr:leucine-rich repeat domain-containing protein [Clostridia bacterium]